MPMITVTETVEAPVEKVFATWNDFGNIDRYNPNLSRSFLINDSAAGGLGAMRQCDLSDGKNHVRERIIGFVEDQQIQLEIFESTVPIKYALVTVDFKPLAADRTHVSFRFDFTPKMGVLGKMMGPLIKGPMRKALVALLTGNKAYLEDGEVVNAA